MIPNYIVVKHFIDSFTAQLLYNFLLIETAAGKNAEGDGQSKNALYTGYGVSIFDSLLISMESHMEIFTDLNLNSTYSYVRLYNNKSNLVKHTDRPECEISVSVCLGYDISNIEDKKYTWPFSLKDNGKDLHFKLYPGDALIYKGTEVLHWREEFPGVNHGQVFLHYVNKNGPYKEKVFDGRKFLGTQRSEI